MAEAVRSLNLKKDKKKSAKTKSKTKCRDEKEDPLDVIYENYKEVDILSEDSQESKEEIYNLQPLQDVSDIVTNKKSLYNTYTVSGTQSGTEGNVNDVINFYSLNQELHRMEPFLKLREVNQIQDININQIQDSAMLDVIADSSNHLNQFIVTDNSHCSTVLNSPIDLLVRQRCIAVPEDSQIETNRTDCLAKQESLKMKPYTEIQILTLYNNMQLEEKEKIISAFLEHERNITQIHFYEIVFNYLKARTNFIGTQKEIKINMDSYKSLKEVVWTFVERILTEEGTCEDDQLLSVSYKHEIASFQSKIGSQISKQLKNIRETVFDSHALHIYSAEILKLQVEKYLQNVFSSCKEFTSLSKNSPVKCHFSCHKDDVAKNIDHLKDCISVLMCFIRRNVQDLIFVREVKTWISDSVAVLLRVAHSVDHLFILNHLLRCPLGIGDWGAHFLQVVPPSVSPDQDILSSPFLDHLVTVLAILLQPVEEREHFLKHLKNDNNSEKEYQGDNSWIVVDSSGEDEEDASEMWHYFKENDVIQFINQIPFEDMFRHILLVENDGEGVKYEVSKASPHSIMKLFAFCTRLLTIFKDGLKTYHQGRFKGVVKRLSRLIRHIIHYVTDHWQGFLEKCQKKGDIRSPEDNAMALRLQVEYDEFFENAVKAVFLSPRCGAWQFLAVIPYNCVSIQRLWQIAFKLHIGFPEEPDPDTDIEDWSELLRSRDTNGRFQDHLFSLGDSESFYLLTALANMAIVRAEKEKVFIQTIVSNLFDATMVSEELRTNLNRTGRDLFLTITSAHPFTISILLSEMQEKLNSVGSLSLYLFRFLCLDQWRPTEEDLQCLSYWILYTPAASLESHLARVVIAKMNWGFEKEGSDLALPRSVHQRVAILVVEVATKLQSVIGQGNLISEGVKQVTSAVYAPSHKQVFMTWCWSMLKQLHVHQMDQSDTEVRHVLSNQRLILVGVGDPMVAPSLEPLKKGLCTKQPLAVFAAYLMSSWGHSMPEICNRVPEGLELLVWNGRSDAALTILSLVIPLFFNQHEDLVSDSKFVNALVCILASDQTYVNLAKSYISTDVNGSIVQLFQGLIMEQLLSFERFNVNSGTTVLKLWLDILMLVPNWKNNLSVLSLLEAMCRWAIFHSDAWYTIKQVLGEQRKIACGEKGTKGGLGNLLNWMSSGAAAPCSLLVRSYAAKVPWFALCVLVCEVEEEISSGVWKALLTRLVLNPLTTVDIALKEVCSDLQIEDLPSATLSLYRLGQQLIDLSCNDVAFPATAQIFLTLHLARTPPQPRQYDCTSVIYKFYEGFLNSNFLKKIKYKMADAVTFWESCLAKEKNKDKDSLMSEETQTRIRFLSNLVGILGAMSAWMEETRLYETGLYIPALPPQLLPNKLLALFQENWSFWPELIDSELLKKQLEDDAKFWRNHRYASIPSPASSSPSHHQLSDGPESRSREFITPSEAIVKRLKEYDSPKAPPPLPSLLWNNRRTRPSHSRDSVLYDIERFTNLVISHSRSMLLKSKEICALDCVYAELLPQLWTNPATKTVLTAKCNPKKNSRVSECSGPASIVVEYCEKRLNEGVQARLDANREQHLSVFNSAAHPPPLNLCEAALQLSDLVNNVVGWHRTMSVGSDEAVSLIAYGRDLFNHFMQLTSEETSSYPPAKQLITSCADTLGQEFLRGHQDCQENLASQVLQLNSQLGVLLSPHFTPMVTPTETYITMYSSLSPNISSQPDVCFMLLSKFEMEAWLREKRVGPIERARLIQSIFSSVTSVLALNSDSTVMCLELYRVHLRALLECSFPYHLAQTLTLLLDMSVATTDCGDVRRNIWYDVLNTISKGEVEFNPEMSDGENMAAIKRLVQSHSSLEPHIVKELVDLLSAYFVRQRIEFGLYGLYAKYKTDVRAVTCLLGIVSFAHVVTSAVTPQHNFTENLLIELWTNLEGLWTAWVAPLGGKARASCPHWIQELAQDQMVLLPWTPGDLTGPAHVMAMFAATLTFFHQTHVGCKVLSVFLEYYHNTYASPAVKDHILGVIHSQMAALPWHHLSPSVKDLEIFSKIVNEYLPECHSFVGSIFIQIPWDKFVQELASGCWKNRGGNCSPPAGNGSPDDEVSSSPTIVKVHVLLLNVLVRISMEPSARQSGLLLPLLNSAERFHWRFVDAKNFESVLNWFVMSCDPRIGLHMDNRNPIDVALISLLHIAAGYGATGDQHLRPSAALKRRLLLRAICRLMLTAATRHKALLSARSTLFGTTFSNIMTQMGQVVTEGLPEEIQFEEGLNLSAEPINLIGGGASPTLLQEVCKDSLLQWLKGNHPSRAFLLPLSASVSKGILHLEHRSPILERCLVAIFQHSDCGEESKALCWREVAGVLSFPLTNPMPMLTFAAQENHLLVIYTHTKWRLHIRKGSSGEHFLVLANLMELLELITPEECCENWLLLLVGEVTDLIRFEIEKGEDYESVWRHVNAFTRLLLSWGEDRASSGLLAAIGLGKKSPLSTRVRLACKTLSVFLKSQLLSPGFFCAINEHRRDVTLDQEENDSSNASPLKDIHQLLCLRNSAAYALHASTLYFALEFIQDGRHCITDAHILFEGLICRLFGKESVVVQLCVRGTAPTHQGVPNPQGGSPAQSREPNVAIIDDWVVPFFDNQNLPQRVSNPPSAPPLP